MLQMPPEPQDAKLPPAEMRVRNTAYLLLVMSWAILAFPPLLIFLLLNGHPMVDHDSGRPMPLWLELLIAAGIAGIGLALNRLARWVLKQYREGRTAYGTNC